MDDQSRSTAAVLVALINSGEIPEIILTQRAQHLSSHPGEVAFPGGMWDAEDADLLQTALREAKEEIGLDPALVEVVATLPSASPKRRNLRVTPFVGLLENPPVLVGDPSEIGSIFTVPVSYFLDIERYEYFDLIHRGESIRFPRLQYCDNQNREYQIWGFTLRVITDMLNETLGAELNLIYPSHQEIQLLRNS
ncbi:MAG: CoA pyrophosphatase [Porticoccaceae bacterium]|nr:CoA pyrophosphatase [Porticoccaceae bacterium]